MEYITPDGIKFFILPSGARCTYAKKHPDHIEKCPICNFDDYGNICVPELCGYYYEYGERREDADISESSL